jgi:hypothetical protein
MIGIDGGQPRTGGLSNETKLFFRGKQKCEDFVAFLLSIVFFVHE